MDIVGCVAGIFITLGLLCGLAPEQVAEIAIRLDSTNKESARSILKRYASATRWSGRIVGGVLVIAGVVILLAGRPSG